MNNNIFSSEKERLTKIRLSSSLTLSSNTLSTIYNNDNPLEELNMRFCGQTTCKFLFVYDYGEQETKANLHFRSFSQLAEKLNRTMILTNVGSSQINICQNYPFDFYYDLKLLRQEFPNVIYKYEDDFYLWLKIRDEIKKKMNYKKDNEIIPPLSILHSHLRRYDITTETIYREVKPVVSLNKCLSKFEPFMNLVDPKNSKVRYTIMDIAKSDIRPRAKPEFSELLVESLTTDEEIMLVNSFVLEALFPKVMPAIPYNDYILNEAQKLKDKLSSSYIAIHWRLEQARPELLPECAQGLIKTLKRVMTEEGIENIYLATDYPLLSSKSQSDTFKDITNYHHEAIRMLNETFKINTWVSLGGLEDLRKDKNYHSEFVGPGLQGILDKLVCIDANYFLAGSFGCSRILSTFTKSIEDERKDKIRNIDSGILNTIDRWKIIL
ncbi:GDP-fucose protein O-fucosyltransferase family protein [Rhizophagus clarus]|nr:GDP-fucose protein O-fucosyltransferase family protein [Rhizophagus clarus]